MEESGRYLTRREFEDVMRRAAELASTDSESEERAMSEEEVLRIGREVGLSEDHVRRALIDMRASGRSPGGLEALRGSGEVRSSRVVPGGADRVAEELDNFLVAGQLLQAVRRGKDILVYRPAVDWASQVARAASATSSRYYVASAKHVEVRLSEAGPDAVLVDFEVDPGIKGEYITAVSIYGGTAGVLGGVGTASALGLLAVAPPLVFVAAGVVAAGACFGGVRSLTQRYYRNKLDEVQMEVEGILDRLETGESLEPPPPSWRRWVKRHFHGVARDLRGESPDQ
jgi:hypothetical protein